MGLVGEQVVDAGEAAEQPAMMNDAPWPVGCAFLFISKANERLREEAPGDGIDKISAMSPVP